ncbi:hypothetical protein KKI23_01465 [Patescibacteria group bacterium]|nr:hypothetical protein [Patescibacteria group bacterium]
MNREKGFNPNPVEGTGISPETIEGEKSITELQKEFAAAELDYLLADFEEERRMREDLRQGDRFIADRENPQIQADYERAKSDCAEATRKLREIGQKKRDIFNVLFRASVDSLDKEAFEEARTKFFKEEIERRVRENSEAMIKAYEGFPEQEEIVKLAALIKKSDEVMEHLPTNKEPS